MEKAHLISQVG